MPDLGFLMKEHTYKDMRRRAHINVKIGPGQVAARLRFTTAPRHPPFRRMGGACVTLLLLAFPLVLAASPDHDCGSVHKFFDRLQRELAHAEKLLEHCGLAFPERSLPAAVDSSAHLHDEIRRLGTIDRLRAQLREFEHGKRSSTTPLLTGRRLMSTASPAGAEMRPHITFAACVEFDFGW